MFNKIKINACSNLHLVSNWQEVQQYKAQWVQPMKTRHNTMVQHTKSYADHGTGVRPDSISTVHVSPNGLLRRHRFSRKSLTLSTPI